MSKLIIKRPDLSSGGYLALPNNIIRDSGLSVDAVGILAILASNSDGWDYTVKTLAKSLRITEVRARNAVRELEAAGLLKREQPIDPVTKKTLDGTWTIDLTGSRRSGIHATATTSTDDASPQVEAVESIPAPRESTRLIEDHDQKTSRRGEAPTAAAFLSERMRSWAKENHPHVNVEQATEKYIAYYADKTTSRKSWEAWIAREKTPKPDHPQSIYDTPWGAGLRISDARRIEREIKACQDAGDHEGEQEAVDRMLAHMDEHGLTRDECNNIVPKPKRTPKPEWMKYA